MESGKNNWIWLFLMAVCLIIGFFIGVTTNPKQIINPVIINDTTYNHKILDSIEYNIIKKDSIITILKKEMKYEIEQSNNLSDSAAVDLFQWLSTSEDDFPSTGE